MEIEIYKTVRGQCPLDVWLDTIRERNTRAKILTRLDRLQLGNFGDCKTIGDGIAELRIHYGPASGSIIQSVGTKLFCCSAEEIKDRNQKT